MSDYNRGDYSRRGGERYPSGNSRFGTTSPSRDAGRTGAQRSYGASRGGYPSRGAAQSRQPASSGRYAPPGGASVRQTPPVRSGSQNNRPKSVPVSAGQRGNGIGGALPRGFWLLVGICALMIVAGVVLQYALPNGFPLSGGAGGSSRTVQTITEIHSRGPVRINEIMTANSGAMTDASGNTSDWIEIANVGSGAVNLKEYILARNAKAGNVFLFPDLTLQPGQCAIVFADGRFQSDSGADLHAPFRLSSSGDVMMLFNRAEVAVDTVNIPALADNAVYARVDANTWEISDRPTPGLLNTDENYAAMTTVSGDSEVQIVELVASARSCGQDENGVCRDYVALGTISGSGADLSGWYLSDSSQLPRMWRFPDGAAIPPGGKLVVHCSGLNRVSDPNHLHTSFKLASEGEQVILSDPAGRAVDIVSYDLLKTDAAYLRGSDGSWSVGTPTVGAAAQ